MRTESEAPDEPAVVARRKGVVIAYKPASWATEPTPQSSASLVRTLAEQLSLERVHAASRLDVGVSGLVLCTTGRHGNQLVEQCRAQAGAHHEYVAIVQGTVESNGEWSAPLGRARDAVGRARAVVGSDGARDALTSFEVLATVETTRAGLAHAPGADRGERLSGSARASSKRATASLGASLLYLRLGTGRMHQIRAHAAEAGHPVLGDRRYGGPTRIVDEAGRVHPIDRLGLHCARIELSGILTAHAPAPAALRVMWARLGGSEHVWSGLRPAGREG